MLKAVETVLDDDQAMEPVVIDLNGKASYADFMVIASGRNARHLGAMTQHLEEKLRAAGSTKVRIEGKSVGDWVLIDGGDVIIHLFRPEIRKQYALEKMWGMELPPETASGLAATA
ncbi:MAG: ribosome silencing factor [Alphaproteobacteria bacterium]|nr:ribosome silencing factor [Alphaproteobacteria bacterium]